MLRRVLAALLLLPLLSAPLHAGTPKFRATFNSSFSSRYSFEGTTADFDGDGKPDVATIDVAYSNPFHVSLLYGLGNGGFDAPVTLPTSTYDYSIGAGDLNGDGRADLVLSGGIAGVYLSQPGRTFGPRIPLGPGGFGCLVADVTGDGNADVVVGAGTSASDAIVHPGDGAGGFAAPETLAMSGNMNGRVAADVDLDGRLDVVAMYRDTFGVIGIGVRRGLGGGSFAPLVFSPIDSTLFYGDAQVADFDGDDIPDAVCGSGYAHGLGNGSFGPSYVWGADRSAGALADMDGDGHLDIVGLMWPFGYSSGLVTILRGHGNGTATPYLELPQQFDTRWLDVADFDLDGRTDVVTCSYNQYQVAVYLATPARDFGTGRNTATGSQPYSVALADVTGDGKRDVVVAEHGAAALRILPGNGDGTLGAPTVFATPADVCYVTTGDLNGDSVRDLVCTNGVSNSLSVFLGAGGGAMSPRADYALPAPGSHCVTGDLNGDGRDDVAALTRINLFTGGLSVWLADATGALGPRVDYTLAAYGCNLAMMNVNGDAYPDVIVAGGRYVSTFPGNGAGAPASRIDVSFTTGPAQGEFGSEGYAAFGDVDGDLKLDAVISSDQRFHVRLGDGSGGFTAMTFQVGGRRQLSVALADLDEDGRLDVVQPNYFASGVLVFPGDGAGLFPFPYTAWGAGSFPQDAAVADMDGDGHLDIVTANAESNNVSVLLNRTPGLAAVGPPHAAAPSTLAFAGVGPLPARDAVRVAFRLPQRGRATLELIDVSGRRVVRTDLGELAAGAHEARLARGGAPDGVYWLRLAVGRAHATAKVVLVR